MLPILSRATAFAGTVGQALPDVTLRVRDATGAHSVAQDPGTLEISGPNVFSGYWENDQATKEAFTEDGFFVTGDLATISEDGVVTIVGRQSDLIISAGFNIYPKEVELHLNQIDGVVESAVFGVPHPDLGEAVVATVTTVGSVEQSESYIRVLLKEKLSEFKVPRRIMKVDKLPTNAMGKIEKKRLREQYRDLFVTD